MHDLKVVTTSQLLQLDDTCIEDGLEYNLPLHVLTKLDVDGRHILHAHSLYNMDPSVNFVRARSIIKAYDSD